MIEYRHLVDDILKQGTMYDSLDSMHSSFLNIVNLYIADGSPNEVNISFQQKKNILKFLNPQDFSSLHPMKLATLFDDAFSEIERVLATNLLRGWIGRVSG